MSSANNKFDQRAGTTDWGKPYEEITISKLAVSLAENEQVEDFQLSTNDDAYGDFDDIVVKIQQKDKNWIACAMQLKHANNKKTLGKVQFSASRSSNNNQFSIDKYFESYKSYSALKDVNLIIFTNNTIEHDKIDCTSKTKNYIKFQVKRKMEKPDFLNLLDVREDIYELIADSSALADHSLLKDEEIDEIQKFQQFCEKCFILPGQQHCQNVIEEAEIKNNGIVQRLHQEYVTKWVKSPKKIFLSKELIRIVMCELILRSYISRKQMNKNCTETKTRDPLFSKILEEADIILAEKLTDTLIEVFSPGLDVNDPTISEEIKNVRNKYFIAEEHTILWHLNKIPLIIEVNEDNKKSVHDAIKLCPTGKRKFLLITNDKSDLHFDPELKIVHKLRDCLQMFQILTFDNLKVSLQGREAVPLKELMNHVEITDLVTVDHLMEMYEKPDKRAFGIGEDKEVLPETYIEPSLEKIVLNTENFIEETEDTIVVSCNGNVHMLENIFKNSSLRALTDYLGESADEKQTMRQRIIIYVDGCCSKNEFDDIKKKSPGKSCHLFNLTRSGTLDSLDWIKSSSQAAFQKIREYVTKNKTIFRSDSFAQQINQNEDYHLICANAGMGKTELTKFIKNHYPNQFWVFRLNCRDHQQFFSAKYSNLGELVSQINQEHNSFEKSVINAFFKSKKIVFIWDGLDELPRNLIDMAITKFKNINQLGFIQWITARPHLKKQLEDTFQVFAWDICELQQLQQDTYIRERLHSVSSDEEQLKRILQKIYKIVTVQNRGLLGVPLQIYLLTEMFRSNVEKYVQRLDSEFTIVKMFEWFIEERVRLFMIQNGCDLGIPSMEKLAGDWAAYRLKEYQLVAIAKFEYIELQDRDQENYTSFSAKLKEDRDDYGIIIQVTDDDVTFIHETFREYLIASWISKNFKRIEKLERFLFEEKNNSIRMLFDIILAENCPLHLAVIHQNLQQVHENLVSEYNREDKCGRNALHLACSWGIRHPLLLKRRKEGKIVIDSSRVTNSITNMSNDIKHMNNIIEILLKYVAPSIKDRLFDFTPMEYAAASLCLQSLDLALANKPTLDVLNFGKFDIGTMAYYSIRLNYKNIFKRLMQNRIPYIEDSEDKNTLLHLAAKYSNTETLFILALLDITTVSRFMAMFKSPKYYINGTNSALQSPLHIAASEKHWRAAVILVEKGADVNVMDARGWTPIHRASREGHLEAVKFLVEKGADVNVKNSSGWTPLRLTIEKGHLEIVKFLVEKGADVNVKDSWGWTLLHYAYLNGHLEIVKFLVEKGADVNVNNVSGWTALSYALEKGHLEIVKFLVEKGADVNVKDSYDWTPLCHAIEKGHLEIVKFLVEKGADVNVKNSFSWTPLSYALKKGHLEMVKFLVEKGADVNVKCSSGWTPLSCALKKGHLEIVKFLVEKGADVNTKHSYGWTPLRHAIEKGHLEIVKFLVEKGADVNVKDSWGWTLLHYASLNGHLEIVKFLVEKGADVNVNNVSGWTALSYALEKGHLEIVKFLFEKGADVNVNNVSGWTALSYALEKGHLEIVKFLFEKGADVNVKDSYDWTPLRHAIEKGHLEIVKFLVVKGADVNVKDSWGWTLLHYASENGHLEIVKFLVVKGADVNVKCSSGWTPLSCALKKGHLEIVKFLVEKGADVNVKDSWGWTLLHYASENGHLEIVKFLVVKGADVNVKCSSGWTPLSYALKKGHLEIVQFLVEKGNDVNIKNSYGWTPLQYA